MIQVKRLDQKRLLGIAGRHAVVTDRKIEDGGSDVGCTSGELLLLAIGSCATGSVRNCLDASGARSDTLDVTVNFERSAVAGERDAIAIVVRVPADILAANADAIAAAAISGGVVSRLRLGSLVSVRCQPTI